MAVKNFIENRPHAHQELISRVVDERIKLSLQHVETKEDIPPIRQEDIDQLVAINITSHQIETLVGLTLHELVMMTFERMTTPKK